MSGWTIDASQGEDGTWHVSARVDDDVVFDASADRFAAMERLLDLAVEEATQAWMQRRSERRHAQPADQRSPVEDLA